MRKILCHKCGIPKPMDPEDVAMGFKSRRILIKAKKPDDHAIKINGVKQPQLSALFCDGCGHPIPDGTEAVAFTMWRGEEPALWEGEYVQVE